MTHRRGIYGQDFGNNPNHGDIDHENIHIQKEPVSSKEMLYLQGI
jgi:hypothetical protein